MEEQKHYHEDLMEWCNNTFSHWNSMRPRVSKLLDIIILEELEGYCRQLKEKLKADLKVDFNNNQTADRLYQQWEQLLKESNVDKEEIEDNSDNCLELEEQKQFHEEFLETEAIQEEIEVESDNWMDLEKQKQYREDLLEWCNNIYSNWESMRPKFSEFFDIKSLEEWEESYRQLKEKLQSDLKVDFDDYQTAERLYVKWEQLSKDSNTYQEEIEVESDKRLELEKHPQFLEEFLETEAIQEDIEVISDNWMDLEKQKQHRDYLLEWCNNIYFNWESMKPRFSKLFDIKSLEEWEESCRHLKEKLQTDINVDFNDFQIAERLYEQWEQLFKEANAYQKEIEVESDKRLELEKQKQIHEDFLETKALQEEIEVGLDKWLDLEEQKQYHEYLLEWCNKMYSNCESMRPRFSKLIDIKSLEEWEESCRSLIEKLQADSKVDFDDYQSAERLHEKWEQLYKESYSYKAMLGV
ncbi:hypothetical protein ABES02_13470 [Neobacillus pocheonensis]|uniref:hypothetical protein n=1 Tax=Neobacillus pocheonensis TaxID=363869 RepID=UPI003D271BB0